MSFTALGEKDHMRLVIPSDSLKSLTTILGLSLYSVASQRFSAWDPRGIKVVARANENLLNTLVLRTGENWPQLVIRCSHHQSESTSVFMAAVHFLC